MRTLDAMNLRLCLLLALATSCLASVPGVDASGGLGTEFLESWQWRRVDVRRGVGSEAITALAADREGEVLAVGGEGGVSLLRNGAWQERLSRVGLVTDLAFAQDGTLWVGTPRRLWRYSSSGQLQQQSPGQGEAARFIHRIATLGTLTVVTTEAGRSGWNALGRYAPTSLALLVLRPIAAAICLRARRAPVVGATGDGPSPIQRRSGGAALVAPSPFGEPGHCGGLACGRGTALENHASGAWARARDSELRLRQGRDNP